MARTLHVYPKAIFDGSEWLLIVKVFEKATRFTSRFEHIVAAGVTATTSLVLLKVVFDLTVEDTDTDQDVDTALFVDDIRPGPQVESAWFQWQELAEGIIDGLDPGYTALDFKQAWTFGDTQAVRNSFNRALVAGPGGIGRGWTIANVHQHEGDGTNTDG